MTFKGGGDIDDKSNHGPVGCKMYVLCNYWQLLKSDKSLTICRKDQK